MKWKRKGRCIVDDELVAKQAPAYQFFGSYAHTLDGKGRIIIPNAYRGDLGETFTVGPTRDFEGVALYPDAVFERLLAELTAMNQRKPIVQKYVTQFFKLSYRGMQPDAQGRLLLPGKLRQRMLGEAKELEVSGAFDHVRIVDSAKAENEDMSFAENLGGILEELGNLDE
ncbi:MAG: hypothetical protein PHY12_10050 [Eubacteriales bacterium]|nr:hypothetical protein [Eubacteriales bacterium]